MWQAYHGKTIYLDTNIIIFAVEPGNPWITALRDLFIMIDQRSIDAVTSELSLAEVLTKPLAESKADLVAKYEQLLGEDSAIRVEPITRPVLRTAAEFQARLGIRLADAIHLATAKHTRCELFLTNDQELSRKAGAEFKLLNLSRLADAPEAG